MTYTDNLETDRLRTRFLTQGDLAEWTAFFADSRATEFHPNPDKLTPGQRAQNWIDFTINRYNTNMLGLQALINKENGEFMGQCGLLVQEVNGDRVIEVGYHLMPQYWRNGYASEAARRFRDYGFENDFADTIVSIIHPLNFNSKKVAGRNGMVLTQTGVSFRGGQYDLFSINRMEWERLSTV